VRERPSPVGAEHRFQIVDRIRSLVVGGPVSDLEERLRKSEIKKRQLQRQIKELIGGG